MTDFALASDVWIHSSNGENSFKALGSEFYAEVNLEPVNGGRLVLFNKRLAEVLGFTAADQKELVRKLKSYFLLSIANNKSKKDQKYRSGFATYYSDVPPDNPEFYYKSGDGRVVWIGEITSLPDGKLIPPMDVTLKGVGRTPMAIDIINGPDRKPHPQALQYGDGLQTMSEAVRSFIASEAMVGNQIRSTVDLAVFELPFLKRNPVTGAMEKAALTVRVGSQVRLAHIEYQKKGTLEHKKIVDFMIRRSLNLNDSQILGDKEALDYLYVTAFKFAELAAKYRDAQFFHGSLTSSNLSTDGFAFDFGTLMAMDVFQPEIKSDATHHSKAKDQWRTLYARVGHLLSHIQAAGYLKEELEIDPRFFGLPKNKDSKLKNELANFFVSHLDGQYLIMTLKRLGLTGYQLEYMIQKGVMPSVNDFMDQVEILQEYLSPHKGVYLGRGIYPSAFDIRKILRSSIAVALLPDEQQETEWRKLFVINSSWSTFKEKDLRMSHMRNYISELSKLAANLQELGIDLNSVAERALSIGYSQRRESFFPDDVELMRKIRRSEKNLFQRLFDSESDFEENTKLALELANLLIDDPSGRFSKCETELNK